MQGDPNHIKPAAAGGEDENYWLSNRKQVTLFRQKGWYSDCVQLLQTGRPTDLWYCRCCCVVRQLVVIELKGRYHPCGERLFLLTQMLGRPVIAKLCRSQHALLIVPCGFPVILRYAGRVCSSDHHDVDPRKVAKQPLRPLSNDLHVKFYKIGYMDAVGGQFYRDQYRLPGHPSAQVIDNIG